MTNTITLTEYERTFLETVRNADDSGMDLILKSLLCTVRFGEEFLNDTQEHVAHKNEHALREIVARYFSRLEAERVDKCGL